MLVGVIHLPALPGSPRSSLTAAECARSAAACARALADAQYDAIIVENFGDVPFFAGRVPAVTVAAMTACALAVREAAPNVDLGINVLRNDAESALGIALCAGARFVRVNVLTGARVTDQGVIQGDAAALLRARRALGADGIGIWAGVDVKHSAPLGPPRPIAQEGEDTADGPLARPLGEPAQRALARVGRGVVRSLRWRGHGSPQGVKSDKSFYTPTPCHVPASRRTSK